ncbi:MAG: hypothetical protein HY900_00485 [Deltaproteobacteria bacterium]|nr:hypothetical protein [Deltaproteobacteria bacterium]
MFGMPAKPWKKVKLEHVTDSEYTLSFVSPLKDENEFQKIIREELTACLGQDASLLETHVESRRVTLKIGDLEGLKRRLMAKSIAIQG